METLSCLTATAAAGAPLNEAEPDSALGQLQAELHERRRVEEELHRLNAVLERRLTESKEELAATDEELKWEMRKRAEDRQEIKQLNEKLVRQANALEVVSHELESFAFAVSHDLRAPLRHVLGFSDALAEQLGQQLDGTSQSYLDCIGRAGRKMESMIESLLNLSRVTRQELNLASVDLSRSARECAALLKESAPERRAVFKIADNLSVRGDAALLRVALNHLFDNAWKYTAKRELTQIEFDRKQEGDTSVFYLRDNGAGFDLRYADKLFAPFQRMHVDSEFEGRGVGLATVQRIIHRHGGKVWADAMVDSGTTIFFTLPDCR